MTLEEKRERAVSCASYAMGACARNGYPPFDCGSCREYKRRKEADGNGADAGTEAGQ